MSRPGSRASAAVRRAFRHADSLSAPERVYGDEDVVTVVYEPLEDGEPDPDAVEGHHGSWASACVIILQELAVDESKPTPSTIRGVCHSPRSDTPVVWLVRREWALAFGRGEIDIDDALEKIVATLKLPGSNGAGGA